MKIYLVGGAVRDELLNYPTSENDYVVVGATPEAMLELGFTTVGKDFPVFLHPETKEEYALARTERKTGRGYQGFSFNTDTSVNLEDDLLRRDLTVNAIAKSDEGEYFDPFHGQQDIKDKVLRHVSDAFREDPVRILRTARFLARYAHLGFRVADKTLELMHAMVKEGEADHLVEERVWKEMSRALTELNPEMFFTCLQECGALAVIASEINDLVEPKFGPESATAIESLRSASELGFTGPVRFSALLNFLELSQAKSLAKRLKLPNEFKDLLLLSCELISILREKQKQTPNELLALFEKCKAFRRPELFEQLADVARAVDKAQSIDQNDYYERTIDALEAALKISSKSIDDPSLEGKALGDAIRNKRLGIISSIINQR